MLRVGICVGWAVGWVSGGVQERVDSYRYRSGRKPGNLDVAESQESNVFVKGS